MTRVPDQTPADQHELRLHDRVCVCMDMHGNNGGT